MNYNIINGNSAEILQTFPDNHFDSIVCDPPYGINFLGKSWDSNTGEEEVYRQCLRVLKPGGYLLAFSAARTYHHLAMAVERCGFEIRDQIMWVYGSGFPKSQDVGRAIDRRLGVGKFTATGSTRVSGGVKEFPDGPLPRSEVLLHTPESEGAKRWSGWGSALKPAHEPIVVARKPFRGSLLDNVLVHGTGALNIDGCRVEGLSEKELNWTPQRRQADDSNTVFGSFGAAGLIGKEVPMFNPHGRFPANFIHDGSGEVVELFPDNSQRFFYSAKVSRRERNIGCEALPQNTTYHDGREKHIDNPYQRQDSAYNNNHPTVKPVALMRYLIKLVTPPRGHVLDPFNGSGSTGMAAVELGHQYTGIELDPHYCEIARKRIEAWNTPEDATPASAVELDAQLWEVEQ